MTAAVQLLGVLFSIYTAIGKHIERVAEQGRQSGELTDEQHDEALAHMNGQAEKPHWLPRGEE